MAGRITTVNVVSQHHYQRYMRLMQALKNQKIDGYFERHHILPKSLGGDNSKENLINLTARQHFIAHKLLWMAYRGSQMGRAFYSMCNIRKSYVGSKEYELARIEVAKATSELGKKSKGRVTPDQVREKQKLAMAGRKLSASHVLALKSRVFTEETREKMSLAQRGKVMSSDAKLKISRAKKGKSLTQEHKLKLSIAHAGRPKKKMSEETKARISATLKGRQTSEETRNKLSLKAKEQWALARENKIMKEAA